MVHNQFNMWCLRESSFIGEALLIKIQPMVPLRSLRTKSWASIYNSGQPAFLWIASGWATAPNRIHINSRKRALLSNYCFHQHLRNTSIIGSAKTPRAIPLSFWRSFLHLAKKKKEKRKSKLSVDAMHASWFLILITHGILQPHIWEFYCLNEMFLCLYNLSQPVQDSSDLFHSSQLCPLTILGLNASAWYCPNAKGLRDPRDTPPSTSAIS